MDRIRAGMPLRVLAVAIAALAAVAVSACGDDGTQTLDIKASGAKDKTEITAPSSADAGVTEITLDNSSKGSATAQLIRVEGDHSADEVVRVLGGVIDGKPFPDWFFAGGGVNATEPSQSATVTQDLQPGTYYVFNDESEGPPDPKTMPAIKVTGEASDALPETDATIATIDYGFEFDGELKAGENEITFENKGGQPHHILASPLVEGATVDDVVPFFKTEKGKPPLERDTASTTVVEGGESQVVTLNLKKPGEYAFYCFVSDRQGGPPHVFKGMVDTASVGQG
ncbi:MAG: hypothetical protein AABM29_06280 [Actinomycetota bacterium]